MEYENFIHELIKLLMNWGIWKDSVKLCYAGKVYEPCQMPKNLNVRNETDEEREDWKYIPEDCVICIECNSALNDLFDFGAFGTDLKDLPFSRKHEIYSKSHKLQEEFDEDEIREFPQDFGIPSEIEFDSADEYKEFLDEELDQAEKEYIANLTGTIVFDNDLEAEIGELCIDYGLEYDYNGGALFIGYKGFADKYYASLRNETI